MMRFMSLDLEKYNVFIPETGIYASLTSARVRRSTQVKLIQTKKYNEIKTRRGITKGFYHLQTTIAIYW